MSLSQSSDYEHMLAEIKKAHVNDESRTELEFLLGFFDLLPTEVQELRQMINEKFQR